MMPNGEPRGRFFYPTHHTHDIYNLQVANDNVKNYQSKVLMLAHGILIRKELPSSVRYIWSKISLLSILSETSKPPLDIFSYILTYMIHTWLQFTLNMEKNN